jgi:hypothetical protein
MSAIHWDSTSTSTWDEPSGETALLRIVKDNGQFLVSDLLGLRYGVGATVEAALMDWISGLREFVEWSKGQKLGANLAAEVHAYRKFLES